MYQQSYGEARRRFWERAYCATLRYAGAQTAKRTADEALVHWEETWTVPSDEYRGLMDPKVEKPIGGFVR